MSVFVLKDSETLVALQPVEFASEDDFQQLLAKFPSLLSGGQTDDTSPRRWLLLKREKSVPADDGGAGRWSVDHLFVDQDGIPTLVEVKRQSDTRLRREVVGQMLDYAANAVVYWPIDQLRAEFEEGCTKNGADPEVEIRNHLGVEDAETLWQRVKINLQAGRIRMLFVADRIPAELRRIVEFLNEQMDPAEMLALELRQFSGEGLKTIVPTVYGQTEKSIGASNKWRIAGLRARRRSWSGGSRPPPKPRNRRSKYKSPKLTQELPKQAARIHKVFEGRRELRDIVPDFAARDRMPLPALCRAAAPRADGSA